MTRHNLLSDPAVNSKKKRPGYYLDGQGLYLQVAPGGSRSWIFRYNRNKKSHEMGLGSLNAFSLSQARERAKLCRQQLADGWDPIERRDTERAQRIALEIEQKAKSMTFTACAEEYHLANADTWKNSKHAAQWINTVRSYALPKLGKHPISELNKQHIVDALLPIWKTKAETASRVLQRIRITFNYAAAKDYCAGRDAEFWEQVKLALGSNERARKVEHHSACPHKMVGSLIAAVNRGPSAEIIKLALEFIVLTASRSGEVRGVVWSEIDEETGNWIIPPERMKAARPHHVPLSKEALDILRRAKKLSPAESPASLIFPSPRGKVLSDMVFTQLLRRMGVPYTVHGFRAGFRTWGSEVTEYAHEMLEFALAHSVGDQTVRAYARSSMVEKRREMMQSWADYLRENSKLVLQTTDKL